MFNTQRIKTFFPGEWSAIVERCEADTDLIEICQDIDRLAGDMEAAEANKTFMSASLRSDVLTSMDALVQEVREKLSLG